MVVVPALTDIVKGVPRRREETDVGTAEKTKVAPPSEVVGVIDA